MKESKVSGVTVVNTYREAGVDKMECQLQERGFDIQGVPKKRVTWTQGSFRGIESNQYHQYGTK